MDIKDCRIDTKVRTEFGAGIVSEIYKTGVVRVAFGPNSAQVYACDIEPIVSDACESCQMIAELQVERDAWKRNAAYWHEELTKLQKEALECDDKTAPEWRIHPAIHMEDFRKKPLSEVGKFYVTCNVDASGFLAAAEKTKRSLLSQEARRVVELLSLEGPASYRSIAATFGGDWGKTMDDIIEARDAGIIELVDGKYQMKEE